MQTNSTISGLMYGADVEDRKGLPQDVHLRLYEMLVLECEKKALLLSNDAFTPFFCNMFKRFLVESEHLADVCSPYTPRLVKIIGTKVINISKCALSYIWRHPYICICIAGMTRILRLALCLVPHVKSSETLRIIGLKVIKAFLVNTFGQAYSKASLIGSLLKKLWNVVTCAFAKVWDNIGWGFVGIFKGILEIVVSCSTELLDFEMWGRLGENLQSTIFNFGGYIGRISGADQMISNLANNMPFVLAQITNQVREVSGLITKPVENITGILLIKIILLNLTATLDYLATWIGIPANTVWGSVNMTRETFKGIFGKKKPSTPSMISMT